MSQNAMSSKEPPASVDLEPRSFLEGLRNRVLRVTAGMRPGPQRLELAIEVFWYAALEVKSGGAPVPWDAFARTDHPLRSLMVPIRLMIRSELINSGVMQPDALADDAMARVMGVAHDEALSGRPDPGVREQFFTWLGSRMRSSMRHEGEAVDGLGAAA